MTAWRFSLAPFGDPGRVISRDPFLTPATGLDIMATWHCQLKEYVSAMERHTRCDTKRSSEHAVDKARCLFMKEGRYGLFIHFIRECD